MVPALAGLAALAAAAPLAAQRADADPLVAGFRNPPQSARPFVWWHWLNGNVSEEGARLDLEWMKRAGIGGLQLFEGNLGTPQIVADRRVFMSEAWKRALRRSVATAADLGLEMSIASSPGWSATGGPWVTPEAAMKKLVWSDTEIAGGRFVRQMLPAPPSVAGPYQDVPISTIEPGQGEGPAFYRDVVVLAHRVGDERLPAVTLSSSNGPLAAPLLADRRFAESLQLTFDAARPTAWVQQSFERPVTIRSAVVGLPGPRGFGTPLPPEARLEASEDGVAFRKIVDLPGTRSPARSASFAPVTARFFRLVLSPNAGKSVVETAAVAPGAIMPKFPPPPNRYSLSEFSLGSEGRVHRAEEKAGFATAPDYYAIATPKAAVGSAPAPGDVIDLSRHVGRDGTLKWRAPPGRWRVLRFGYSLTGHHNGPAPKEATGLEVDKLNAKHVGDYIGRYLGLYRDAVGADLIGRRGINSLLSDSIESGPQNWTEDMPEEFRKRRGYDLLPWLPALAGTVVGGAEASDRFLWDFRRTIAELLVEEHYGVLAREAHARGMTYYAEALEDHRPQLGDDMEMRRHADVPMGAMWTIPAGQRPNPTYVADLQGAASVAHVYGKPLVGAESLTAFARPWAFAPRDLKPTVDLAFALGVTRPIIHTSAHQPLTDGSKPGLSLAVFLGQYFNRNETWAEQARGWTDYLARTSYLLRQGRPVADIAYFYGEEAPITGLYGDAPVPGLPPGHAFDFVGAHALLTQLAVRDGDLVTTSGVRYPILVLGGSSERMTLAVLRKIAGFAAAGATIVGNKPAGSPSLADDDREFAALAERLWSRGAIHSTIEAALAARSLGRDWGTGSPTAELAVLHRRLQDGHLYFISNRGGRREALEMSFRVAGKAPELWRADTGTSEPLSYRIQGGRTFVPLTLEADDALFVLLRKPAAASAASIRAPSYRPLARVTGAWRIAFQAGRGAPPAATFDKLASWTTSDDPGIRYFSGTATYSREVDVPRAWLKGGRPLHLDLGEVREIAEVAVNGRIVGQLWKPPYRIDLSKHLRPGRNRIEIKLTNLWVNRLIGDAQPGARKITFTQAPAYSADAPLRPSGLLGPVTLLKEE